MTVLDPVVAREILEGSAYPQTRRIEQVHLVEAACICFTSRTMLGQIRAFTAVLRHGPNGPVIPRVLDGWPIPEEVLPVT